MRIKKWERMKERGEMKGRGEEEEGLRITKDRGKRKKGDEEVGRALKGAEKSEDYKRRVRKCQRERERKK